MSEGIGGLVQEILVPVRAANPADRGLGAAVRLALASGCPVRLLHVRPRGTADVSPDAERLLGELRDGAPSLAVGWEVAAGADVARTVLDHARSDSLIVMATDHANRWGGKDSISEHVLDCWTGATMLVGPVANLTGPAPRGVLVGLDGSSNAERAVPVAEALARCLGGEVLLSRIVPDDLPGTGPRPASEAETQAAAYLSSLAGSRSPTPTTLVVRSNDPISALVAAAGDDVGLVVLSSRGDRTSARSTISRVCTGVAAAARQPVVVVGSSPA